MSTDNERCMILDMIDTGKITAAEGLDLIKALTDGELQIPAEESELLAGSEPPEPAKEIGVDNLTDINLNPETTAGEASDAPPAALRWRGWWKYPLWVGVTMSVIGAMLMYWAQQAYGLGFLFFCAWIPLMAGVFLMALAWQSRLERWVHIRVEQPPGEWPRRIAISLPVAPVAWCVRTFKGRFTGLQVASVEDILRSLEENTSPDNPLYIEVVEGEHGERVQVFIG